MAKNNHNDVRETIREITANIRELTANQLKTDEQLKKTDEQLGHLGNSQGYLVEGLIAPAIPNILRKMGITEIYRRAKNSLNGDSMEVDVIGPGEKEVVVCEIKSKLKQEDVDELLEKLPRFTKFFPRYKGLGVTGLVAGVNIDDGIAKYAENKGLYVLVPSGDTMKLANTKSFKPKYF